jgi:hypothetical protein
MEGKNNVNEKFEAMKNKVKAVSKTVIRNAGRKAQSIVLNALASGKLDGLTSIEFNGTFAKDREEYKAMLASGKIPACYIREVNCSNAHYIVVVNGKKQFIGERVGQELFDLFSGEKTIKTLQKEASEQKPKAVNE